MQKPAKNQKPRPALSPFQAEQASSPDVAATIEAINVVLLAGRRGGINIPTGHANAVKAAFEGAGASDLEHPERRWTVDLVAVTPMFATLNFRDPADPPMTTASAALFTIQQLRAEVEALRAMLAVQIAPGSNLSGT